MKDFIQKAVKNDLPILLFGRSGWGKTEMVEQVGVSLKMDVVKVSLALSLPEDVGGIPCPSGDTFRYLLPDWFYSRKDDEFILFLDEINQASPQVLHSIYSLVQERRLHNVTNKKMRVVAAGNLAEENVHLTEIMQPLLNRFYVVDFVHDMKAACEYLNRKFGLSLKEIENSPRDTEQGLVAYFAGMKDLAIKKAGMSVINAIENIADSKADELIRDVRIGKVADRNGFIS